MKPFPITLSISIGTKNHGVLETLTKIQFHHTNLNLTNLKFLTNWQAFHSIDWTWMWMWPRFSTLWFSFKLWFYVDSDIFTQFGPISRANIDFRAYRSWNWTLILDSHIPLMGNECEFKFFDLEPTIESKPTFET